MKNCSKLLKTASLTLAISTVFCLTACADTAKNESYNSSSNLNGSVESVEPTSLVKAEGNYVIITVNSDYYAIGERTVLSDYMDCLKTDGVIDYSKKDGMLNSLNGISNATDWSHCWMLYSNDSEVVNSAYGTYEIEGVTYTSTAIGMDVLPIKNGFNYVWVYMEF